MIGHIMMILALHTCSRSLGRSQPGVGTGPGPTGWPGHRAAALSGISAAAVGRDGSIGRGQHGVPSPSLSLLSRPGRACAGFGHGPTWHSTEADWLAPLALAACPGRENRRRACQ
jgi:hypothetical protein